MHPFRQFRYFKNFGRTCRTPTSFLVTNAADRSAPTIVCEHKSLQFPLADKRVESYLVERSRSNVKRLWPAITQSVEGNINLAIPPVGITRKTTVHRCSSSGCGPTSRSFQAWWRCRKSFMHWTSFGCNIMHYGMNMMRESLLKIGQFEFTVFRAKNCNLSTISSRMNVYRLKSHIRSWMMPPTTSKNGIRLKNDFPDLSLPAFQTLNP